MSKEKVAKKKNKPAKKSELMRLDGALLKEMVSGGAEELRANIDEVNRLNVFPVPDGDTGDNMFSTVDSGLRAIQALDTDNLAEVMHVLSHGMLLGARGNSGVILSQFFKGAADGFKNAKSADPKTLAKALELGVKEAYKTVITPTEGTILTVARESVEYAVSKINERTTIKSFFDDFVKELHESVERTPESLPALKEAGVVDSGGAGLFYLMDGFNRVLRGEAEAGVKDKSSRDYAPTNEETESIKYHSNDKGNEETDKSDLTYKNESFTFDENTKMTFSYCTELLVQLTRAKCDTDTFDINALREFLVSAGDSAAVIKSGSVVKIHVHTMNPDKILCYMLKYGEFISVKVENMSLQHSELLSKNKENEQNSKQLFTNQSANSQTDEFEKNIGNISYENNKRKKYGVVAVSVGSGSDELFKRLGADVTINAKGGSNPSAADFLESARRTNAEQVFIFPNNSNFILSAEQASKMADDISLHVIPSKNIALGYVALSVMNFENESTEEIIRAATKALTNALSGCIFTAARDAKCSGLKIKAGDILGTIGNNIAVKAKNAADCSLKVCKKLLSERFVLTIFKGESATDIEVLAIEKRIKKSHPEAEIYIIDSGQDVFEYLFVAE